MCTSKTLTNLHVLLFVLLTSCYFSKSACQRQINPEIEAKINDYIENAYFPSAGVSGLGLAIVNRDGTLLYTNGYGLADVSKNILNENGTQFNIGSITKSFTAMTLVKILHETFPELGEAVLDTPIRTLLPQINFTLIDRFRSEHGTVRDLLAHRMCIPRDDLQLIGEPFNTTEEIIYRQRYAEPVCGIRTRLQYNNQMYVIAGEILTALTNRKYEEVVGDLLKEIGVMNSTFSSDSDDYSNLPQRSQPYYVLDGEIHLMNAGLVKRVTSLNAAAGLFASPDDMAKYLQFHLNLGNVDGKQVIPEEVMLWMRKPAIHTVFPLKYEDSVINTFSYGLGLYNGALSEQEYIYHDGWIMPYRSLISLFPGEDIGIFSTSNQAPVQVDQMVLHSFILETLKDGDNPLTVASNLWGVMKIKENEKAKWRTNELEMFLKESELFEEGKAEDVIGKYGNGRSGDAEILEKWDEETNQKRLFVTYGKWTHGWLNHVTGQTYKLEFTTDAIQDFYAMGVRESLSYVRVVDDILEFVEFRGNDLEVSYGKFKLGVSLDKLPPIPWLPGSCGID